MYQLVLVPQLSRSVDDAITSRYGYGCSEVKFGSDSCQIPAHKSLFMLCLRIPKSEPQANLTKYMHPSSPPFDQMRYFSFISSATDGKQVEATIYIPAFMLMGLKSYLIIKLKLSLVLLDKYVSRMVALQVRE